MGKKIDINLSIITWFSIECHCCYYALYDQVAELTNNTQSEVKNSMQEEFPWKQTFFLMQILIWLQGCHIFICLFMENLSNSQCFSTFELQIWNHKRNALWQILGFRKGKREITTKTQYNFNIFSFNLSLHFKSKSVYDFWS